MFSRILIKLIDQAVVPAVVLLVVRLVSLVVVSKILKIDLSVGQAGFTFSSVGDYVLVNSYSALFMIGVLTLGLFYILFKSLILHETHISPGLTARVFSLRLSSFIQTSFDLYSQGAIWLSYSYLLTVVSGAMAFFGLLYTWVFIVAGVLSFVSTLFLVYDIENEAVYKTRSGENTTEDEYILTLRS